MEDKLLDILCCPLTHQNLQAADGVMLSTINNSIAEGKLINRGGDLLDEAITEALVTLDQGMVYPIINGMPVLLEEACIVLKAD